MGNNKIILVIINIFFGSDAWHLEFLIWRIYRPFNSFCLHVDQKSDSVFKEIVEEMAECYNKKFRASNIKILSEVSVFD